MSPRVSVLVPSYNYARFLRRCMDSVLAQTYSSLELVVSDDASTDDSDSVVHSYDDPRIVYERQPVNLGMVPNWERCVALSRGEYLLLLGADDTLMPSMIEDCVQVLDRDPDIAFCHTGAQFVSDAGRIVGVSGAFERSYVCSGRARIERYLLGKRVVNSAAVFRRSAWLELGGWSHDYRNCMDLDLWFRMLLRWKVGFVGKLSVRFRSHPVSHAWMVMQAGEDLRFLRAMFARLPHELEHLRHLEPELVRSLCSRWLQTLHSLPATEERDLVMAELARHASVQPQAAEPPSARTAIRRAVSVRCAALPAPLRHLIGDLLGSLQ